MRTVQLALLVLLATAAPAAAAVAPGEHFVASGQPGLNAFMPGASNSSQPGFFGGGSAASAESAVSQDGRFVAFISRADGLDPRTDDDRYGGVYVRDTVANTTELVSISTTGIAAQGDAEHPAISEDGRHVTFVTGRPLAPQDTNVLRDVYVRDRQDDTTTLVSTAGGVAADGHSGSPDISDDGARIAFDTLAENLDGTDGGGIDPGTASDVYLWDRADASLRLVSVADDDTTKANNASSAPSVDEDGTRVAFQSTATNLDADDGDNLMDIYVRRNANLADGFVDLVSRADGAAGAKGEAASSAPSLRGDVVAFLSRAENLDGTNNGGADNDDVDDVYLREFVADDTALASVQVGNLQKFSGSSGSPALAGVASSLTTALVAFRVNDAGTVETVVRDPGPATTSVVSRADGPGGALVTPIGQPGISVDGTAVVFDTVDDAVTADGDDDFRQVVMRDGTSTLLVSKPTGTGAVAPGDRSASLYSVSGGRRAAAHARAVVFTSDSDAYLGLHSEHQQVFLRDLTTGAIELISRTGSTPGDASSGTPSISDDGRLVLFTSQAANLGSPFFSEQVYLHDRTTGTTTLLGKPGGGALDDGAREPAISPDGRFAFFSSSSPDLGAGALQRRQVFRRDLQSGAIQLVSTGPGGAPADEDAERPSPSFDGSKVAFESDATNLGVDGEPFVHDIYVRDIAAGTTALASRSSAGAGADDRSEGAKLSFDGTRVAFTSIATNLHPQDTDSGSDDIFVRDVAAGATHFVSRASGEADAPSTSASEPGISPDGRYATFTAFDALAAGEVGFGSDLYARDLTDGQTRLVTSASGLGDDAVDQGEVTLNGSCAVFASQATTLAGVPGSGSPDFTRVVVRGLTNDCGTVPAVAGPGPGPEPVSPGPGPAQLARDLTAPTVGALALTNRTFRVGRGRTAVSARKRRRVKTGTQFRFRLSERATVTIVIAQRTTGRIVGRSCRKATAKLRKRKRCTRYLKRGTLTRRGVKAGAVRIAFSGRIGKKALPRGGYRAAVVARDAAGNRSAERRVTFTVVK